MVVAVLTIAAGCMVGPDYRTPPAPTSARWLGADEPGISSDAAGIDEGRWWHTFDDPALDALVTAAYAQNLTLQAAGLRVAQAQARRGIAIGGLFPQTQQLGASYARTVISLNQPGLVGAGPTGVDDGTGSGTTGASAIGRSFDTYSATFDAAWELDLWGRFRRGIEASDAELLASVAAYDDVLVSLVGEVAATYVSLRVIEERLALAHDNVRIQRESLGIADVRYQAGGTSALDVQQAQALLSNTEADIPGLEIDRRRAVDALSVLLGMPPNDLADVLGRSAGIPKPPKAVAVGIPADLLRRRPDIRRAERQLAAASADIGVAKADLLPRVQLAGSVGLEAEDAARWFEGRSFEGIGGPQLTWPVFNYGRLINAVRVQDAVFQEQAATYAQTVLGAQQEVEDALIGVVRGADQVDALVQSVTAANRAVELSLIQYREGATDYTTVLNTQETRVRQTDRLASSRGAVVLSVVALYKALGGGWEIRADGGFVAAPTRAEMRARTWWGDMLDPADEAQQIDAAAHGTEGDRLPGALRWRWWWPEW